MQRVILSLFCPILVAIVVRIALVIISAVLAIVGFILGAGNDDFGRFVETVGSFDTFVWDSSWCYWIIVAILTFLAEMVIWQDD